MGPLAGLKVVELAGIGPGPFCAMLLADMGAEVLRIDRKDGGGRPIKLDHSKDVLNRGRLSVAMDLKNPAAVATVLDLCAGADALIEGFRPGVMERMGLGPAECLKRNPKLVYGRMTGWGQDGPLATTAGHDINYIAISGVLHMFGRAGERPVPPANLVGDMGGGGLLLAFGIVCAVLEARRSGWGQVVDAAMVEGASLLASSIHGLAAMGYWDPARWGVNLTDTGAHFYEVYETKDGRHVAVGAIESQFYALLLKGLGLESADLPPQMDPKSWPAMKRRFADIFRTKTRAEWEQVFAGTDACVSPVLSPTEATANDHMRARGAFTQSGAVTQPAPAPRFSRTPGEIGRPPPLPGEHTTAALAHWGLSAARIQELREAGAIA
ncbi:MAG TPA: CaiB/BaiF CoA-transferase family protein [Steroidobacteraceae bacterium]|nr:CaiB/BaiF CoA-transferase family protein [Steroidobacteraceae bacterium]